jgi:hypothetical protein
MPERERQVVLGASSSEQRATGVTPRRRASGTPADLRTMVDRPSQRRQAAQVRDRRIGLVRLVATRALHRKKTGDPASGTCLRHRDGRRRALQRVRRARTWGPSPQARASSCCRWVQTDCTGGCRCEGISCASWPRARARRFPDERPEPRLRRVDAPAQSGYSIRGARYGSRASSFHCFGVSQSYSRIPSVSPEFGLKHQKVQE